MIDGTDTDFERASASELAAAVAARRVSAVELCEAAIDRIERRDAALNAVVVRDFDRARQQARACDQAAARGEVHALLVRAPAWPGPARCCPTWPLCTARMSPCS